MNFVADCFMQTRYKLHLLELQVEWRSRQVDNFDGVAKFFDAGRRALPLFDLSGGLIICRNAGANFIRSKTEGTLEILQRGEFFVQACAFALSDRLAFHVFFGVIERSVFRPMGWLVTSLDTVFDNLCPCVHRLHHQAQSHSLQDIREPSLESCVRVSLGLLYGTINSGNHSCSQ
jgi:hypothetical protein